VVKELKQIIKTNLTPGLFQGQSIKKLKEILFSYSFLINIPHKPFESFIPDNISFKTITVSFKTKCK